MEPAASPAGARKTWAEPVRAQSLVTTTRSPSIGSTSNASTSWAASGSSRCSVSTVTLRSCGAASRSRTGSVKRKTRIVPRPDAGSRMTALSPVSPTYTVAAPDCSGGPTAMSSQSRASAPSSDTRASSSPASSMANRRAESPLSLWIHQAPGSTRLAASPDASVMSGEAIVPVSATSIRPEQAASNSSSEPDVGVPVGDIAVVGTAVGDTAVLGTAVGDTAVVGTAVVGAASGCVAASLPEHPTATTRAAAIGVSRRQRPEIGRSGEIGRSVLVRDAAGRRCRPRARLRTRRAGSARRSRAAPLHGAR